MKKGFSHLGLAAMVMMIVVGPWIYRNYVVFDSFPLMRTGVGTNLLMTLRRADVLPDDVVVSIAKQVPGTNELEEELAINEEVMAWVKNHSAIYWRTTVDNFIEYWWETARYRDDTSMKYYIGRKIPYIFLLILSLPVMIWKSLQLLTRPATSLSQNVLPNMGLFLIVYYTVVYTLFGAHNVRYHFPVEFMMIFFGAEALSYLSDRILRGEKSSR